MDRRMRDLYAHYGIPNNVPFNQVAVPGNGSNRGVLVEERERQSGGPAKSGPLFLRLPDVFFRLSTHRSNVCRTLVTGTAGNPNRLYKHRIMRYSHRI